MKVSMLRGSGLNDTQLVGTTSKCACHSHMPNMAVYRSVAARSSLGPVDKQTQSRGAISAPQTAMECYVMCVGRQ